VHIDAAVSGTFRAPFFKIPSADDSAGHGNAKFDVAGTTAFCGRVMPSSNTTTHKMVRSDRS
jgi:hypothetical protein